MSFTPSVSLIIVSRKRQASLRRTLSSLRFQSYQNFEVIVVSDAPDASGFADLPFAQNICHLSFDAPNISAARNIGIDAAQGEVVAFCDDDAVPDPKWLERLVQPFADQTIASAGGFVRGRNGIEYQWQGLLCDALGEDHPLDVDVGEGYRTVPFDGFKFAKLQGTNCAFRASALEAVGGFDEGFRFFLDETDVCLRLAQAGFASAFVPLAQVHHGYAESEQRSDSRAPKTLFDIGASKRRFLDKHSTGDHATPVERFVQDQRKRLLRLMVDGRIEPRDVTRLMGTLREGLATEPTPPETRAAVQSKRAFTPLGHAPSDDLHVYGGSTLSKRRLIEKGVESQNSHIPTLVMLFSITSFFHKRDFDERGFWMQTGGLFGKSNRSDPMFVANTLRGRIMREYERVQAMFPGTSLYSVKLFRNFVLEMTKSSGKS